MTGVQTCALPIYGVPAPEQPRIVSRPSPFQTRYEFIYQTVLSGLTTGNAYWLLGDRDYNGFARTAIVLDPAEVSVTWDDKRLQEVITWRNRKLVAGVDVVHLAWGRRPGEVLGRSVIAESLDALSALDAAEEFASSYFLTAGVPSVVIKSSTALTKTEAETLKAQWINAHTGPQSTPAVLSGGIDLDFPGHDPQKSQLQETRAYAATVVARLFGIPAPLLLCETSGATITYLNGNAAFQGFLETTLAPT